MYLTDSHADYFVRNILLLLAEIRCWRLSDPAAAAGTVGRDRATRVGWKVTNVATTVACARSCVDPASTWTTARPPQGCPEPVRVAVTTGLDRDEHRGPVAHVARGRGLRGDCASREYGRRGPPRYRRFADVGVSMLPRMDPTVRELLQLGEYQPPVVA
jgi:hypothetical protein